MSLSLYRRAVKSKIRKIIRANLTVLRFRCYLSSEQVGFTIKVLPELYNDSVCVVCVCFRDVKRVLFVPYALHDRDAYTKTARDKFKTLGPSSFMLYTVCVFCSCMCV